MVIVWRIEFYFLGFVILKVSDILQYPVKYIFTI